MSKHFLALGAAALMSLAAVEAPAMSEHEQEVAAWRTGRIERLTAPDGWLSLVGLQVDLADDGQRAVQMATERPYDLVLMDMQMPVLDGLDATS